MRKLQDLSPDLDKQTNTAAMLDMAVEYIKDLQKHVKAQKRCYLEKVSHADSHLFLSAFMISMQASTDNKAKCRSSSKQKHYSIASA
ncbi:hypothetical protein SLE2022_007590 [Rubroshorea leprosula]